MNHLWCSFSPLLSQHVLFKQQSSWNHELSHPWLDMSSSKLSPGGSASLDVQSTVEELASELFHLLGQGQVTCFNSMAVFYLFSGVNNPLFTFTLSLFLQVSLKALDVVVGRRPRIETKCLQRNTWAWLIWGKLKKLPHYLIPNPSCIFWDMLETHVFSLGQTHRWGNPFWISLNAWRTIIGGVLARCLNSGWISSPGVSWRHTGRENIESSIHV